MKYKITSFLAILLIVAGCGTNVSRDAKQYHQELINLTHDAYQSYNDYTQYAQNTSQDIQEIDKQRKNTIDTLQETLLLLQVYDDFDGDSQLREATLHDISTLIDLLEHEEYWLIRIWETMDKQISPQYIATLRNKQDEIIKQINQKVTSSDATLQSISQQIQQKYDYNLSSSLVSSGVITD